jgi:hypothetical protein
MRIYDLRGGSFSAPQALASLNTNMADGHPVLTPD